MACLINLSTFTSQTEGALKLQTWPFKRDISRHFRSFVADIWRTADELERVNPEPQLRQFKPWSYNDVLSVFHSWIGNFQFLRTPTYTEGWPRISNADAERPDVGQKSLWKLSAVIRPRGGRTLERRWILGNCDSIMCSLRAINQSQSGHIFSHDENWSNRIFFPVRDLYRYPGCPWHVVALRYVT